MEHLGNIEKKVLTKYVEQMEQMIEHRSLMIVQEKVGMKENT